jgi:hypothetical protein
MLEGVSAYVRSVMEKRVEATDTVHELNVGVTFQ